MSDPGVGLPRYTEAVVRTVLVVDTVTVLTSQTTPDGTPIVTVEVPSDPMMPSAVRISRMVTTT